ncbi:hypothetical protein SAMN04488057_104124 [Cyclobacterium lianum]|uniref:HPt domain-containing protein n=1 Tax=Cyclobacterium lianum TaxID=388280 RepID=A0A1M7M7I9_9BACT|nr:hypothetical protein [Cyclobacterium lianum]SHM86227.1 hypothetical protein SAMN04488057_104124 [Cyclobacterium lianum]
MSKQFKNIDFNKIEEMVEDDVDFRNQLLDAITVAVEELRNTYVRGIEEKSLPTIKQARHKIKPTLGLFDLEKLAVIIGNGKRLLLENGFGDGIDRHKEEFLDAANEVLEEVKQYR